MLILIRKNIRVMEKFLKSQNVPSELKSRTIKYLEFAWKSEHQNAEKEKLLLERLPESLKKEILYEANRRNLSQFKVLVENFSEELLNRLASLIQNEHFSPKETIYTVSFKTQSFPLNKLLERRF